MNLLPSWLTEIFYPQEHPSVPASLVLIFFVLFSGVILGKVKIKKVSLGVSGVVFIGILMGHFGYKIHPETQDFLRDFGLILFVYAIGMQLGPSFFGRLKKDGFLYNGLAVFIVLLSMGITYLLKNLSGLGMDSLTGLMCGAVTNTPSLGAAKAALHDLTNQLPDRNFLDPTNSYAIAYPFGILGIIFLLIFAKFLYKNSIEEEIASFKDEINKKHPEPESVKIRVTNTEWIGKTIGEFLANTGIEIIFSRLKRSGSENVISPLNEVIIKERDILMAVGFPTELQKATSNLGYISKDTFIESDKFTKYRMLVITNNKVVNKTIGELNLDKAYHAKITRVYRSGVALLGEPELILHYGDVLRVVGSESSLQSIERLVGNSEKHIQEPQLLSIFVGIVLGVVLGSVPFYLPGLSVPVKLGMAAGPLLVAILISRFGGIRSLHSYLQISALSFMKDFGICLFFASIGIHAGETFYDTFIHNNGFLWLVMGLSITLIPGLLFLLVARYVFHINLIPVLGLLAGSHTDPAALQFATNYYKTDLPLQSYATVYPLTTLARIVAAQILILYFI